MWADNETELDLLGFDVLVDELIVALTEPALLPLTVGVLGDWGSGKSSLLKIARRELEADAAKRYVCVEFSPWLYEDYDDVKAALITAVLDACRSRATTEISQQEVAQLKRFPGLMRRARTVGRVALGAAPAVTPALMGLVDPSMADSSVEAGQGVAQAMAPTLAGLLAEPPGTQPDAVHEIADVSEFREAFARLVGELEGVVAVIVFRFAVRKITIQGG